MRHWLMSLCAPSSLKLTDVFPAEAASSSGTIGVQVSISEVTLLVEPQATFVIIQYLLPVGAFSCQSNPRRHISQREGCRREDSGYSHVDLVDLVLQLFIRGKLFEKLVFLILAPSVTVLVVAADVTA